MKPGGWESALIVKCDMFLRDDLDARGTDMYATRELVDEGGLLSYSVDYAHLYFRAATFVDKI
jgi:hypothetical protein